MLTTAPLDPISLDRTWIEQALLLSDEAGWNQVAADWDVFFTHGTVLGCVAGDRLVATTAALPYGKEFGWISMVLVTADWRRQGLAHKLVTACTSILRDRGQAALLDAAPAARGIYEGLGYVALGTMERWEGVGGGMAASGSTVDLAADLALDRFAFGADRGFLLKDFLSRPASLAVQAPLGFALLRQGSKASHLGPLVAEPGDTAGLLVEQGIRAASGRMFVDVLDAGCGILPILTAHGFELRRNFTRMALGLTALPGNFAWLQTAAGPEFG